MRLQCQTHPEQPLDLICLGSNCEHRGVICFLCKLEQHSDHDPVIPLKPFINSFLQGRVTNENLIKEVAQIDQQLISIQGSIGKVKRKCFDYCIIEEAFGKFWKASIEQVNNYDRIIKELSDLVKANEDSLVKSLNIWIEKHSGMYLMEKQEGDKDSVYANFLKRQLEKMKDVNMAVTKITEKANFEDSELLILLQIEKTVLRNLKMHFSEELKGPHITIHTPTKAGMTSSGSQRMVLLEPALDSTLSFSQKLAQSKSGR